MSLDQIFSEIPAGDAWLVPGSYIEFDNRLANTASLTFQTLLIAPKLATGAQADNTIVQVTRSEEGVQNLGVGSIGARMVEHIFDNHPTVDLHVLAVPDAGAGVQATGSLTFTGSASAALTFLCEVGAQSVTFSVASGDTQDAIASALAGAITAADDLPVTAVVNGGASNQVDFTARHKGETGNDIVVSLAVTNVQPTSPAVSGNGVVQLTGGTTNADLTTAIAAMGDDWYQVVICPFNDDANLDLLEAELEDRWTALRQIGGLAFVGFRGTQGETTTFASARNSHTVCTVAAGESVSPAYELAAIAGAVASRSAESDPARPMGGLQLKGFQGAPRESRFTAQERNLLLRAGVATYTTDAVDRSYVEWFVASYTQNTGGFDDDSYRSVNTLFTLQRLRWEQRKHFSSVYQGYKLADDEGGTKAPAGGMIMTPRRFKAVLLSLYETFIANGWVQDYANYAATLDVQLDGQNVDRLNFRDQPTLVRGLRIIAGLTQFK